jgi:hypothetical protein
MDRFLIYRNPLPPLFYEGIDDGLAASTETPLEQFYTFGNYLGHNNIS